MLEKLKKLYHFSNTWTGTIIIVLLVIFFVAQAFVIPSGSMKSTMLVGDHLFVKKFSYGVPTPHIPWLEIPILPDFKGDGHLISAEGPKRGDIVVFRYPKDEKIHYVKRCVAVGGDEVLYTKETLLIHPHEGDEYVKANYPKQKIIKLLDKLWVKNPYMSEFPGIHYDKNVNLFSQLALRIPTNEVAMQALWVEGLDEVISGANFNAFYKKIPTSEYFMMGDNRDHSSDSRFWGSVPYRLIVGKPWFVYFSWDENYILRWDRIGKMVSTLQKSEDFNRPNENWSPRK